MADLTLNAKQLACLASPRRNEVLMQLRILGQASIRELADALQRSPESTHYHVRALVDAGLAQEAFRRPAPKKPEAVYQPIGKRLRLPKQGGDRKISEQARKAVAAGFRQSARDYLRAADAAQTDPSLTKDLYAIRMNIRLSDKDLKKFRRRLEEAVEFADRNRSEKGRRVVWATVMAPVVSGTAKSRKTGK